jgi:A/G-specific adenine glycosylase
MLQQTRVETVIPYYERFLTRFPAVEILAAAREEEVLALWSGLGYYRRARLLHAGAQQLIAEHGGRFPAQLEEALRIPGVGPYTAAAVLSIAYNLRHPVIDGNVERVVTRLLRLGGSPREKKLAGRLRQLMGDWIPAERAGDFNQAMMELGATVCTPSSPRCESCPLRGVCEARHRSDVERFPELPARRQTLAMNFDIGILENRHRYLLERETRFSFLEGLWLFPLLERGEGRNRKRNAGGIARRLSVQLGVEVKEAGEMSPLSHSITYRRITLWPKILEAPRVDLRGKRKFRWARLEELGKKIPVSSICLKLARRL